MSSAKRGDNPNRQIDEELVSVDSLKHVLCTRCGCSDVHLRREQHDPPDFTVTIDGESFPTEVTSIVSLQQYRARCEEFAGAIHERADCLGVLSGTYAVIISRLPRIPKPTSNDGRQVLDTAVAYIDATKQQEVASEVQLAGDRSDRLSIKKVSPSGSIVDVVGIPAAMWGSDIQCQLAKLIQQAVDKKKRKLQDVGISSGRALLLLYDAFAYAGPEDALAAIQQVNGYEWFHSIFWAASFFDRKNTTYPEEPGRNGLFLFSNDPGWNRIGTIPFETGT